MRQIFILTNFSAYLKSYSPIIVTASQIEMLKRGGYEPVLIAAEGWDPPEDSVFSSIKTVRLPSVAYQDPPVVNEQFDREVDMLYRELKEAIDPNGVVITHDLIFLPDYVKHNVAARRLAEECSSINWIHWVHSATSPGLLIQEREMYGDKYKALLNDKFPNSVIAYPNAYDIPRVARNFSYEQNEIFEVPHATHAAEGMSPIVQRLYDDRALDLPTVLMVYPLRLDRGKNAEMNIRIMGGCKAQQISSHLVFCDFQSTGGDKITYREELKTLARELGVEDRVTFLSEFDEAAQMEIPHKAVLELLTLSNVFCLPSQSETYSLVAQEAMLKGNLCILNHDFAPMRQIYGQNAIYRQFSSNIGFDGFDGTITTHYDDINQYFSDMAMNIRYWLQNDKVLRAKTWVRTERGLDNVFKQYVEPLLTRQNDD